MNHTKNELCLDLDLDITGFSDANSIHKCVILILKQATQEHAARIKFALNDKFEITYSGESNHGQMGSPPKHLFKPFVVILCNYASVSYCTKGPVKGEIQMKNPDSNWILTSDDLNKQVYLLKRGEKAEENE